jgi:hypothetical protein
MDTSFVPPGHGMDEEDKWHADVANRHARNHPVDEKQKKETTEQEIEINPETKSRLISMRTGDSNKLKEFARVVVEKAGIDTLKAIFAKVFGLETKPEKKTNDKS